MSKIRLDIRHVGLEMTMAELPFAPVRSELISPQHFAYKFDP